MHCGFLWFALSPDGETFRCFPRKPTVEDRWELVKVKYGYTSHVIVAVCQEGNHHAPLQKLGLTSRFSLEVGKAFPWMEEIENALRQKGA